jgi:hypothetical protein
VFICESSVADPGCLSRIPEPDLYSSRITDPTTTKEEAENICCLTFFCAANFTKLKIILFSSEIWVGGSEVRDPEKTYPGSRVQKAPNPRHCMKGKRNIVVQEKFLSLSRPAETEGAEEVGNI